MMSARFGHERLDVYQVQLGFVAWLSPLLEHVRKGASATTTELRKRLGKSGLSVLLNIAEGNGKERHQPRVRFFDDARSASAESAACLDALVAKGACSRSRVDEGKAMLVRVVQMLTKLMQRFDDVGVVREGGAQYEVSSASLDRSRAACVFDHEKLDVYQLELSFVGWVTELLVEAKRREASGCREICDHLDRASLSALLKTAGGNAKRQNQARAHLLDVARASSTECAACLDALAAGGICARERVAEGKQMLIRIVQMLTKLVAKFSGTRSEPETDPRDTSAPVEPYPSRGEDDDEDDNEDE